MDLGHDEDKDKVTAGRRTLVVDVHAWDGEAYWCSQQVPELLSVLA